MSSFRRRVWNFLRKAKLTTYVFLLLGLTFIRPTAFMSQPGKTRPTYGKLPGLWGAPFLVATLYTGIVQSIHELIFFREMKRPVSVLLPADILYMLHSSKFSYYCGALIICVIIIYGLATLCWLYHFSATVVLHRWWPAIITPPLKYFVVMISAWGLWFGIGGLLILSTLWSSADNSLIYPTINSWQYSSKYLLIFIIPSWVMTAAQCNSSAGMDTVYGGLKWLRTLVGLAPVVLLGLIAFFISYF